MIEDHLRPPGRAAAGHGLPVARHRIVHRLRPTSLPGQNRPAGEFGAFQSASPPTTSDGLQNLQHRRGLAARQPPGQRRRRRAAFPHRERGFEERVAVRQADRDEIAGLDALGGKRPRAAVGVALELIPGDGIIAVADRDRVLGLALGIPARHVGDGNEHGRFRWRLADALVVWMQRAVQQRPASGSRLRRSAIRSAFRSFDRRKSVRWRRRPARLPAEAGQNDRSPVLLRFEAQIGTADEAPSAAAGWCRNPRRRNSRPRFQAKMAADDAGPDHHLETMQLGAIQLVADAGLPENPCVVRTGAAFAVGCRRVAGRSGRRPDR